MKKIITYVGRFQPFHKGHYAAYKDLVNKFGKDNVYIGTSDKTDKIKSPLNFKEKHLIITTMFNIPSEKIIQVKNPYKPLEILNKFDENQNVYVTAVGKKDSDRLSGKYFLPYKDDIEFKPYKEHGYIYIIPEEADPISGTMVRSELNKSPEESKAFFTKAFLKYNEKIHNMLRDKISSMNEVSKEQFKSLENEVDRILYPIDVDFGKEVNHFFQRINDPRNKEPITKSEIIGLFRRLSRNKKYLKLFIDKYTEFVISDRQTHINIPFKNEIGTLIAKTILRKPNFRTSSPVLRVENDFQNNKVEINYIKKSLGVPRNKMPQINSKDVREFVDFLNSQGVKVTKSSIKVSNIKMTQKEINVDKVKEFLNSDSSSLSKPVIISNDNYILDGHHRIVALYNIDNNHLVNTLKVDLNIKNLLILAKKFPKTSYKTINENIELDLVNKYGIELDINEKSDYIELSKIIVPKEMRGQGIGSKAIEELINYAKKHKKDIFVTPSDSFGGNKSKLEKFYKSFGFKNNFGRNRDFRSKESLKLDLQVENKINTNNLRTRFLLEGGAYGHMAHPFDVEMNLTFGDLKDIVSKALNGELELSREKTDGQAIAISWKNGKLISARNKGHVKNAGENAMSENELISKFDGRGSLSDAFTYAIKDLSNAIKAIPAKEREEIFKEGKAFMQCEVIYPENTNVIPYGQSLLIFHGTMEYDENGNPISKNTDSAFNLEKLIKSVNANVQKVFKLQGPPVTELPRSKELSDKQSAYISKINNLQKEFNLSDNSGVQDYHQAWWEQWITSNAPKKIQSDVLEGLIKRWAFYDKTFRLSSIKDTDVANWVYSVEKKDHKKIAKENLMKFEEIFLGVGADVLSFMKSVLVVNPKESLRKIVDNLDNVIKNIRSSNSPESIEKLELELKRLESLGGFEKIVPNEGIVFNFKGNTYKLTGAFAPLNQILGIFQYSR